MYGESHYGKELIALLVDNQKEKIAGMLELNVKLSSE